MTKKKPGPEAEAMKIEGDWKAAVGSALRKPKPAAGWPKPDPMPQRAPKMAKKPKKAKA